MNRVLTEFIPARQVSLTDRVHDQILELIIKNATEEEMVLTEKKLMELLGVSKAPVREALIKLCSEDVLINVPRFGYRVVRMTEKDARDAKQMRMLLETEALKLSFDHISGEELHQLKKQVKQAEAKQNTDVWEVWEDNEEFFLSMLITNDVALITFVPLALIIMKQFSEADRKKWMLKCVVMQTVAANLGSMLTPIGNPQNLYLYGRAGMNISSFFRLMLPYSLISLALLLLWIWLPFLMQRESAEERQDNTESGKVWKPEETSGGWMATDTKALMAWGMLFEISLLAVGRILVWQIPFVLVLLYGLIWKREILRKVDYSLLGTFTALFIFIGNLGRIPAFSSFLQRAMQGREVLTAVFASQVMSNVPAAILLSGFTDQYQALIIGTNFGGLGTLIASMASLISFKYMVREDGTLRGSYLAEFTVANLVFLAVLLGVWWI